MIPKWDDRKVESIIGTLLRWGVLTAALVIQIGGIWYLSVYWSKAPDYGVFHGEPTDLRTVEGIVAGVLAGRPRHLIQFGLLVLIATPVARVAFALMAFWFRRDHAYMAISAIVLAVLVYSLNGGR